MSSRSRRPVARLRSAALLVCLSLSALPGCWEQWSETWFPQMKWQKTVQAFERTEWDGSVAAFTPPEGTVPVAGLQEEIGRLDSAAMDALVNPTNPSDFRSIARGQEIYNIYCNVCHGETGMGDGAVSMAGPKKGPFAGVYPLAVATARSDGYIWNVIRIGAGNSPGYRMPNYRHIPDEDRWHLVNYVRHLQRGGQP